MTPVMRILPSGEGVGHLPRACCLLSSGDLRGLPMLVSSALSPWHDAAKDMEGNWAEPGLLVFRRFFRQVCAGVAAINARQNRDRHGVSAPGVTP